MYVLQPILPSTDLDRSTLDNHTKSESLVAAVTRRKRQQDSSHGANSIRHTLDISLIKHTLGIQSLCAIRQGITILDAGGGRGRGGGAGERKPLMRRVMEKFYRSSQGSHSVALNMDRD